MATFPADCDILVVGGGTAGAIAALQASLAGAEVVLIEAGSQLGGTMTTGGVAFPGLFHAWGRQIIAGLGWELIEKTVAMDGGSMPDFSVPQPAEHWRHQIPLNGALYAMLAEEAILNAGVTPLYYTSPMRVCQYEKGWHLELAAKGEKLTLDCRQLVDCTGNATVVKLAGFKRRSSQKPQPGTLMFRLGGYDSQHLDSHLIQYQYKAALADGLLAEGDFSQIDGEFIHFLQNGGSNAQHIPDADNSSAIAQTETNIAGRRSLVRLLRFVRTLPGCENARVVSMAVETGVRETYRIVGEETVTIDHYRTGMRFDDAICYTYYPVDLHTSKGIFPEPLAEGVVPTIPLRALIPEDSQNLIVAGRCVSSDQLANSALRVQASCMAMGQAAGAAAAVAISENVSPSHVSYQALTKILRQHKAIVP